MKALFITFEALSEYNGISKKIKNQVEGFRNNGINMELSYLQNENESSHKYIGRVIGDILIEKYSESNFCNKFDRICRFKKLFEYIQSNDMDFVFIRYVHIANPFFISFLKGLKDQDILILMEIPTFPYDNEYQNSSINQKILIFIEKLYRKKFIKYVDKIVTVQNYNEIFGVETIKISNGININAIPLVKDKDNATIHLIGVASINIAHGYDRIINGLIDYYSVANRKKVVFHIVGNDSTIEAKRYKQIVVKYNLNDFVIFHGSKYDKELDSIFNLSHIGIGCLGNHRKNVTDAKSLKNREYCARGIPFLYSENDDDFDGKPFVLKVPADESPIDILKIIEFLKTNNINKNELRNYAERYLTWDSQIKIIIDQSKHNIK